MSLTAGLAFPSRTVPTCLKLSTRDGRPRARRSKAPASGCPSFSNSSPRTAAPCRSSMANSQVHISASACPADLSTPLKPKNARMPHNIARTPHIAKPLAGALLSVLLSACATDFGVREREPRPPPPVVDKNAASVAVLTEDLQLLQKLMQAPPAEQAEMMVAAQRDYETA